MPICFTKSEHKRVNSDIYLNFRPNSAEEDGSDDEKLVQLVDSIQTSFSQHSKALLGDVADTLVPAVNHVKQAHHILNERVDRDYGAGILDFNEACVKMERLTIAEYEEVHNTYEASKVGFCC